MRPPRPTTPGLALLPLRLFLGATFVYAGVQKLTDPGFLLEGSSTYIGSQLEGFSAGTPAGWVLETFALPIPEVAGVGVALTEIAVGLLTLAGRFTWCGAWARCSARARLDLRAEHGRAAERAGLGAAPVMPVSERDGRVLLG